VKRVLLSTDFSKNAQHAIDYALYLFDGITEVHYFLINSYSLVSNIPETLISLEDLLQKQSENGLKQSRKQIVDNHGQLEIETISAYGEPPAAIRKVAHDQRIDLVVLGSRGGKALGDVVFGSTTTNLVRKIGKPMLIVPSQFPVKAPQKILFATDLTQMVDLGKLEPMLLLAREHNAEVVVMNVTVKDENGQIKNTLKRLDFNRHFEGINYRFEVAGNEDILAGISAFVEQEQVDLLVLSPRQYPYFRGLFHKSVTTQMIRRSDIPILVI
jgi:nucleotide-binding universal stress UspA family protein